MNLLKHHESLDQNGEGKCSVPMWVAGVPAGFCDATAYGEQIKNRYKQLPYCIGLACPAHGGPKK